MESMREVLPLSPVAAYIGGKRNLAKTLVARIERVPHTAYCEPFVGMGGVFLKRRRVPAVEVINDFSRDVSTFFRVLQRHYVPFMEMMRFQLTTRAEFERLVASDPATLTDLERSARFFYLQRTAFGGKVSGRNFGVATERPGRFDVTKLGVLLDAIHERLAAVVIECLDFREFISRYDRPGTLFYIDPPYWGAEKDYGRELFARSDFADLAALLAGLKGTFILSLNDRAEVRRAFSAFRLTPIETTYTLSAGGNGKRVKELIITPRRRRKKAG